MLKHKNITDQGAKRIAIFASGAGSNALNIIRFFENIEEVKVVFVLSNKQDALVLEKARKAGVKTIIIKNSQIAEADILIDLCEDYAVDFIILAGFLRQLPEAFVEKFPRRIINIHPALLPKYGGKGMYGEHVHKAVLKNGERDSGITIHYVDAELDTGEHIAQFRCEINENETLKSLQEKIHQLEHRHYPQVLKNLILS